LLRLYFDLRGGLQQSGQHPGRPARSADQKGQCKSSHRMGHSNRRVHVRFKRHRLPRWFAVSWSSAAGIYEVSMVRYQFGNHPYLPQVHHQLVARRSRVSCAGSGHYQWAV